MELKDRRLLRARRTSLPPRPRRLVPTTGAASDGGTDKDSGYASSDSSNVSRQSRSSSRNSLHPPSPCTISRLKRRLVVADDDDLLLDRKFAKRYASEQVVRELAQLSVKDIPSSSSATSSPSGNNAHDSHGQDRFQPSLWTLPPTAHSVSNAEPIGRPFSQAQSKRLSTYELRPHVVTAIPGSESEISDVEMESNSESASGANMVTETEEEGGYASDTETHKTDDDPDDDSPTLQLHVNLRIPPSIAPEIVPSVVLRKYLGEDKSKALTVYNPMNNVAPASSTTCEEANIVDGVPSTVQELRKMLLERRQAEKDKQDEDSMMS